jgi:hypothetical protein
MEKFIMKLNAQLRRKDTDIKATPCEIDKIVTLPAYEFLSFTKRMAASYDFIAENAELMGVDADNTHHCILVLGEGADDGVLVHSSGADYARYSAYIPNARQIIEYRQEEKQEQSDPSHGSSPLPFELDRANQLLDKALDWIGTTESGGELYNTLGEQLHMSDEEISAAGFDTLSEYFEDTGENAGMKLE